MSPTRRLTRGVYVGDVTALCALPPTGDDAVAADTASDGARPRAHDTLLAGTGASLKWYDPFTAGGDVPLLSTTVFPSARVHGIHPSPELDAFVAGASGASGGRAILVWGERRVSVVTLSAGAGVAPDARTLRVTRALLPLGHWVHDARPMLPDARVAETTVAVGLADNAVEQWSLGGADASASAASSPPALLRRVECSRRSMLYSLALRGSRMADLRVAGGTIFNEVQLWAPDGPSVAAPARSVNSSEARTDDGDEFRRPAPFAILRGHEGSIMRVSWSRDGTRVFSTSDDRTARTWRVADRAPDDEAPATEAEDTASATKKRARGGAVLYGHGGRVWDCQPVRAGSRHLLVTAGEDCAVRLWEDTGRHETGGEETRRDKKAVGREGAEEPKPVATLRGHRGRGVWRCATVRNPRGSETLVTAGADASIKLWDLSEYEAGPSGKGAIDTFAGAATPPAEAEASGTDGSDVPRAVCLAASGAVFVGTERGAVHEARRPRGDEKSVSEMNANNGHGGRSGESGWVWRANLFAEPSGGSIVSVAVVDVPRRDKKRRSADEKRKTPSRDVAPVWLAVGDALGRVTVLSVADGAATATRMWSAQASPPRRLLDVLVGHGGDIFAAVVGGAAALWRCETDHEGEDGNKPPTWVADGVARSPFRQRALRASRRGGVFALGDQSGNVAVFDASGAAVAGSNPGGAEDDAASLPLLAAERGAHGAHSVSFVEVRLGAVGAGEEIGAEIVTGGRDGRLCVFALRARRTPATEEETRRAARRVDFEAAGVAAREAALAAADDTTRKKAARALAAALDRVATARAASVALAAPFRLEREAASRVAGVSSVDGARWDDGAFSFSSADDGFANGDNHAAMAGVSSSPALVAGFRECDFVIRDLRDQTETLRVACGGWKRPFALRMRRGGDGRGGAAPATAETAFAFAFVKGGKLTACVRRGSVGEGGDGEDAEAGAPWRARALNVWSHGYARAPEPRRRNERFVFPRLRSRYPVTFHNSNPRPRSRRATEGGAAYTHDPRGHASLPPASDAAATAETRGVGTRLVRSKGDSEGTANSRATRLFFLFHPATRVLFSFRRAFRSVALFVRDAKPRLPAATSPRSSPHIRVPNLDHPKKTLTRHHPRRQARSAHGGDRAPPGRLAGRARGGAHRLGGWVRVARGGARRRPRRLF